LALKLVLLQLRIAVWAHRNRSGTGQQVDAMVVRAHWREPRGLVEDGAVLQEEAIQQGQSRISSGYGQLLLVGRTR